MARRPAEYQGEKLLNHRIIQLKKMSLKAYGLFKEKQKDADGSPSETPNVEILDPLTDVASVLDVICKDAEAKFLEIGEKLQTFYFEATELARQTLDAVKLVGGEGGENVLVKVKGVSRNALHALEGQQAGVAADLYNAEAVVEQLEGLFSFAPVLEKISLSLGVVGLNIGIEGAKTEQAQEKFSTFSSDIRQLSRKIAGIGLAINDDAKAAMATQKLSCAQISLGLTRMEGLAEDAGDAVHGAVRQVEELTGILFEVMEKAGNHSKEISQRMGEIVVAIQFHDNMSQRVAHIVQGLDAIQNFFKEGVSAGEEKNMTPERMADGFPVLSLQAAQLSRVISEIDGIYQSVLQAFDEIQVHVKGLGERFSTLEAANVEGTMKRKGDAGDPMGLLERSLVSLNSLLGDGRTLSEEMRGAASHASHVAERVACHTKEVHGISFETHMMALNAIIKAAHLGDEGRVFEVLAQEVKRLSDRSTLFATDVEKRLTLINASASALQNEASDGKEHLMGEGEAKALLDTGLMEITSGYATFTENSLDAQKRSVRLKEEISSVMSGLTFLPELAGDLTVQLKRMEAVMAALQPFAAETENLTQGKIDHLVQRYTTSEEREIHGKMLGAPVVSAGANSVKRTVETSTEDVVIFEDAPEEISHEAEQGNEFFSEEAPPRENASNDNVELFDDFSADPEEKMQSDKDKAYAGTPDARKKHDEDDLGDNIELF